MSILDDLRIDVLDDMERLYIEALSEGGPGYVIFEDFARAVYGKTRRPMVPNMYLKYMVGEVWDNCFCVPVTGELR